MLDKVVFTRLTPGKIADIVAQLKQGKTPEQIANPAGIATDSLAYVESMVESNVRTQRPIFFRGKLDLTTALEHMLANEPSQVIDSVVSSKLRGRGGAGFSTGLKWRLCRDAWATRLAVPFAARPPILGNCRQRADPGAISAKVRPLCCSHSIFSPSRC